VVLITSRNLLPAEVAHCAALDMGGDCIGAISCEIATMRCNCVTLCTKFRDVLLGVTMTGTDDDQPQPRKHEEETLSRESDKNSDDKREPIIRKPPPDGPGIDTTKINYHRLPTINAVKIITLPVAIAAVAWTAIRRSSNRRKRVADREREIGLS
jgi:hypothetical protein